ncbi:LytTR family DNA-binding domain-containing protein [Sphingomonas sp. C3-2]|uniref:LytTR family DNA-binding domain-containing protein n=1 Tax=Sphingomonas sp. C3-2 TaxID=3062169 RepID=UPI00294AA99A|nr:LytTR family DNA-binding domain-containing protein [Sphingomonas sp. C3-2]WOK35468.1 LytTR family DNA-binding domain-containing protein [Sphingomonas sp. C3-2]
MGKSTNWLARGAPQFPLQSAATKLAFLLLTPLCMALILGWNGVGMLKPWPARSLSVFYWVVVTPGIWLFTYLLFSAVRKMIGKPLLARNFLLLNCACVLVALNLYRPINSYFALCFGRIFNLSVERVARPWPIDFENFIDWQLAYLPFVALWVLASTIADKLSRDHFLSGAPVVEFSPVEEPRAVGSLREHIEALDQNELISVSAEDHYVRVHHIGGEARFLCRFSHALDILQDHNGLRIHRSHWAAREHMLVLESAPGKSSLRLSDGRRLPVSASYRDAVLLTVRSATTH